MTQSRQGISPIVAAAVLVAIGSLVAVFLLFSDVAQTVETSEGVPDLELLAVNPFTPVTVGNAESQLVLFIYNKGTADGVVHNVYINSHLIEVKGVKDGDTLEDSGVIATSIPKDGLIIPKGETVKAYIWIGGDLGLKGTEVVIQLQNLQSVGLTKNVTIR